MTERRSTLAFMRRMENNPHGHPVQASWQDRQSIVVAQYAALFECLPVGEAMDQFERDALRKQETKDV